MEHAKYFFYDPEETWDFSKYVRVRMFISGLEHDNDVDKVVRILSSMIQPVRAILPFYQAKVAFHHLPIWMT